KRVKLDRDELKVSSTPTQPFNSSKSSKQSIMNSMESSRDEVNQTMDGDDTSMYDETFYSAEEDNECTEKPSSIRLTPLKKSIDSVTPNTRWYFPYVGTKTSPPGLCPFRKRKVRVEDSDDDDSLERN
ncbi:27426_t:CDS:2, partial [Racocetra persica]